MVRGDARAANGAYAVDAAEISEVGSCKVESWISTATNSDFSAVANPSCVVNIFRPVELSLQTIRSRSDGDWSTTIAPKAKKNLVPTGIGKFGISVYGGGSVRCADRRGLAALAVVPATYRLSEDHADQPQRRLDLGSHRRPPLFDLRYRLGLEVHR